MMIKSIFSLFFSLFIFSANAHQADVSATVLAEQNNNNWVLSIKSALTAFQYEIRTHYGEDAYATPEEFQELVLNHVQENISMLFDEKVEVVLENGIVRLGHETNVIFSVRGIPENFKTVNFTNSSFKNINRNQSALLIVKKGIKQSQFVLNNKNQHTAKLIVKDAKFEELFPSVATAEVSSNISIWMLVIGVLGLVLFFVFKKRSMNI